MPNIARTNTRAENFPFITFQFYKTGILHPHTLVPVATHVNQRLYTPILKACCSCRRLLSHAFKRYLHLETHATSLYQDGCHARWFFNLHDLLVTMPSCSHTGLSVAPRIYIGPNGHVVYPPALLCGPLWLSVETSNMGTWFLA